MKEEEKNTLNRFSDRVENYVKFRPRYPDELFTFLEEQKILKPGSVVADIGSGTGISSDPFVQRGFTVYGVEPNDEMRLAAEKIFAANKNFISINGTAEKTNLENNSVDLIIAGQAFHWFDRTKSRVEFNRILKPGGYVVLMWNDRRTDSTDFLKVYEDFLQLFGTDYKNVNHKNIQEKEIFEEFFGAGNYEEKWFYNYQDVDFAGLKGRVLSASYMPNEQHPDYNFMIACLKKIFMRYQENGKVRLDYDTKIYYGKM
jgi:ubiquinone/menaquinone biosynthesis C-methylase UbiE